MIHTSKQLKDKVILLQAFNVTCNKRETLFSKEEIAETLTMIEKDTRMAQMWAQFKKKIILWVI